MFMALELDRTNCKMILRTIFMKQSREQLFEARTVTRVVHERVCADLTTSTASFDGQLSQ